MYSLIIADDEQIIRNSLAELFDWNGMGFSVEATLKDGCEVIAALKSRRVDAIMTDIRMKEVSGLEVAKYVAENCPETAVVIISGYNEFEFARQAMRYNVKQYILKPVSAADITKVFTELRAELDEQRAKEKERLEKDTSFEKLYKNAIEQFFALCLSGFFKSAPDAGEYLERFDITHEFERKYIYMLKIKLPSDEKYGILTADIVFNILKITARNHSALLPPVMVECVKNELSVLLPAEMSYDIRDFLDEAMANIGNICEGEGAGIGEGICVARRFDDAPSLAAEYCAVEEPSSGQVPIENIKKLVIDNIADNISLYDMSQRFYTSYSYLSRAFKEQTGENFSNFVTRAKMEKACEYLRDPARRVADIAAMLGYGNIKYFYKLFKRIMFVTPSDYRKRYEKEAADS